jgi:hypothetical protein
MFAFVAFHTITFLTLSNGLDSSINFLNLIHEKTNVKMAEDLLAHEEVFM